MKWEVEDERVVRREEEDEENEVRDEEAGVSVVGGVRGEEAL